MHNNKTITIDRGKKGKIFIRYATEPWILNVDVAFRGPRGRRIHDKLIVSSHLAETAELLGKVAHIDPALRDPVLELCEEMYFTMGAGRINMWLEHADEIAAALKMIDSLYKEKQCHKPNASSQ